MSSLISSGEYLMRPIRVVRRKVSSNRWQPPAKCTSQTFAWIIHRIDLNYCLHLLIILQACIIKLERRKSRLKVRARWGAANISCLSTKRSKKWAKSCKKGQKCLQIRLSVGILITFQLLFTDRHKIVSLKFNVTVKQHTMWIILSVSLDLSVFVCWPNRFTDRIGSHVFDCAHGNRLEPKGQSQLYLQLLSSAQIELSSTQSELSSAQIELPST